LVAAGGLNGRDPVTGLVGRGLRWGGGLMLVCIVLLLAVRGLGGWLHSPQLTFGIQRQHLDLTAGAVQTSSSSLMAYDVWTGQTSAILAGLDSLPVAWSWSPDGRTLAYVLFNPPNNTYSVIAFTPVGRQQDRLAEGLPFGAPPEWSPDGTRVALVSRAQDICLYTIAQPAAAPDCLNVLPAGQPTWSPDGASIGYLSRLPGGGIYQVALSSRAVREILPGVPYLNGVRWSPDGTRLVFSRQDAPGEPRHLALINADGTGFTQITNGSGGQDQPRWSQDGTEIAYNSFSTALRSPDIYVLNVASLTSRPVATHAQIDADPHWSPDGQWLSFVTDRYDGRPRLQIVPIPMLGQPEPTPGVGVPMHLYSYDWRP